MGIKTSKTNFQSNTVIYASEMNSQFDDVVDDLEDLDTREALLLLLSGTRAMTGALNMNGNYIDNVPYIKSSAYDYELNLLLNHGIRVRPSLVGFTNDLYFIVEHLNLANKPRAYFGINSASNGYMELGYSKNSVNQAWLQFIDKVIKPWEDNTHDFGAAARRFANIYGVALHGSTLSSISMTGTLDMDGNFIDDLSYAKSSAYDYELNMLMNHGARIRPSLVGFTNDLYLIVEQHNLTNKPRAYFGVNSADNGFVELGYYKDAVAQAFLQLVDKVIKPFEDNTHDLGASDRRFANIHATNIYSGDLVWEEKWCVECGLPFKKSDEVVLKVKSIEGGTRTVPIHLECSKKYKELEGRIKHLEEEKNEKI